MTKAEREQAAKEVGALDTLLKSEWFAEENENANYHSLHGWLEECLEQRAAEVAVQPVTDP